MVERDEGMWILSQANSPGAESQMFELHFTNGDSIAFIAKDEPLLHLALRALSMLPPDELHFALEAAASLAKKKRLL
jgi:hypothetical protein